MTIKAIETVFDGYRFRSRLEARWAVFFKTLGVQYEYEKEGFDLDGIWYLPDFWLPEQECWIEIKGELPVKEENEKCRSLALATCHDVYILWGDLQPFWQECIDLRTIEESKQLFKETGEYYPFSDLKYHGVLGHCFQGKDGYLSDTFWKLYECSMCGKVVFAMSDEACDCDRQSYLKHNSPRLIAAYTAARQARFEHGETPR